MVCALYIPEVTFGNNRYMEPIVTSKLPKERFSKVRGKVEERGRVGTITLKEGRGGEEEWEG